MSRSSRGRSKNPVLGFVCAVVAGAEVVLGGDIVVEAERMVGIGGQSAAAVRLADSVASGAIISVNVTTREREQRTKRVTVTMKQ